MLRSKTQRWWTAPIVMLLGLMIVLGAVALRGSGESVEAGTRPTCPPFVFTTDIDPAVALRDTGPELDCIPLAVEDPYGPEKHAVPLAPADAQAP